MFGAYTTGEIILASIIEIPGMPGETNEFFVFELGTVPQGDGPEQYDQLSF